MLAIIAFKPCRENGELLCEISSSILPATKFDTSLKILHGGTQPPQPIADVTSHFLAPCIFTRLGREWYHHNADDYSFQTMQRNGELLCEISSPILPAAEFDSSLKF